MLGVTSRVLYDLGLEAFSSSVLIGEPPVEATHVDA